MGIGAGNRKHPWLGSRRNITIAIGRWRRTRTPEPRGSSVLALGLDYTFVRSDGWLLMAQAGAQYVDFGDIFEAESGFGFFGGTWITLNPQFCLGSGEYLFSLGAGLLVTF